MHQDSTRMNRTAAAAAAVLLLAAFPVLAQSALTTGATVSPPPGALLAPGEPASLTLIYTGDVIGYVDPCG